MCISLHVKYQLFLSDFDGTWILLIDFFKNAQVQNFIKIFPVGAELFLCGWTDVQAEKHYEANSRFSQFAGRT